MSDKIIKICYTNYRKETAIRTIIPQKIYFGATEWHQEEQWLLEALDVEKQLSRVFAIKDIKAWF